MSNVVDPKKFLDGTSPELEKVLNDPFSVSFRGRDQDLVEMYPDHISFREATVDLENENVEVKMNTQSGNEGYTTVIYGNGMALVESQAQIRTDRGFALSTAYYLLTDENTLMYTNRHWEEVYNPGVRDAAELAPELYERAKENTETSQETEKESRSGRPVPPPTEGDFTE